MELNLREGKVRLLFVADELPKELRRLIEFLNQQFTRIEVLGVELRQYVGQGLKALVPRIVGQTESVRQGKERSASASRSIAPRPLMDRNSFLAACPPDAHRVINAILDSAPRFGYQLKWNPKSFSLQLPPSDSLPKSVIFVWLPNSSSNRVPAPMIEAYTACLKNPASRESLVSAFEKIPGFIRATDMTIRCVLIPSMRLDIALLINAIEECARKLTVTEAAD